MKISFKKPKYVQMNTTTKVVHKSEPNVPSGSWIKCTYCGQVIYREDFDNNLSICPGCEKHFRMSAPNRLELTLDKNSFKNMFVDLETINVLEFEGYDEKIRGLKTKTGVDEGVICGTGTIEGIKTAIAVMDSRFLMGSMGQVVGEKITLITELASKESLPLIIFTASGGARMQEGIISLMQMAKTSAALKRHHEAGGLYITVLTDPTSGGVTASFAMLGDIILSEPGAFIGFAGPRVIRDTIKQELPDGFQKAEFLLKHGFIDAIVPRQNMKSKLYQLLKLHHCEEVKEEIQTDI
jgi:acetyl-CoA carboxylase carboxyl transferase subunit beta